MWASLCEYVPALGRLGWALLTGLAAALVGAYLDIAGPSAVQVPREAWQGLLVVTLVVAPFVAFHKMRVQRDDALTQLEARKPDIVIIGSSADTRNVDETQVALRVVFNLQNKGDADATRVHVLAGYALDNVPSQFGWWGEPSAENRIVVGQPLGVPLPDLNFAIQAKKQKVGGGTHYDLGFDYLIIYVRLTWWDRQDNEYDEEWWWTYTLGTPVALGASREHVDAIKPYVQVKLEQRDAQSATSSV